MEWHPFNLIQQKAAEAKLSWLLIGGHAINWYVEPRATLDVDFLSCVDDKGNWSKLLQEEGFKIQNEHENFIQFSPPHGVSWRLDIMLVNRQTHDKLCAGAQDIQCLGVPVKVPRPEHLVALKLHAMRHGPDTRFDKDLGDVLGLIRNCRLDIDGQELKETLQQYGTPEIERIIRDRLAN